MPGRKDSPSLRKKRVVLLAFAVVFAGVTFIPSAVAHDPDCAVTVHAGPVKVHEDCKDGDDDPSPGGCVVSVKVEMVRIGALC